jgi:hypothetical protein
MKMETHCFIEAVVNSTSPKKFVGAEDCRVMGSEPRGVVLAGGFMLDNPLRAFINQEGLLGFGVAAVPPDCDSS